MKTAAKSGGSHTTKAAATGAAHGQVVRERSTKLAERIGTGVLIGVGVAGVAAATVWTYSKYFVRGTMGR